MFTGLSNIAWNFPITQIGGFAVDHWNFIFPPIALLCGFYLFKAVLNSVLDALIRLFLQLFCRDCGADMGFSTSSSSTGPSMSPSPSPSYIPASPMPSYHMAEMASIPMSQSIPALQQLGASMVNHQQQTISQPALVGTPVMQQQQLGVANHQMAEISQPATMPMMQGLGASAVNYLRGGQTTNITFNNNEPATAAATTQASQPADQRKFGEFFLPSPDSSEQQTQAQPTQAALPAPSAPRPYLRPLPPNR